MCFFAGSACSMASFFTVLLILSCYWPVSAAPTTSLHLHRSDVNIETHLVRTKRSGLLNRRGIETRTTPPPSTTDYEKVAVEMRGDKSLISKLNSMAELCDPPTIKGVNFLRDRMKEEGYVQNLPCIFYTDNVPFSSVKGWASLKFKEDESTMKHRSDWKYMTYFRSMHSIESEMYIDRMEKFVRTFVSEHPKNSGLAYWFGDAAQKNFAQAAAEVCSGNVYVVLNSNTNPRDDINNWDIYSAWGGWEIPALTRNPSIKSIIRVDSKTNAERIIWKQGQKETTLEPKGIQEHTLATGDLFLERSKSAKENGWLPLERELKIWYE